MTHASSASPSHPGPLVLYLDRFWISPYAFTCFVALREKSLAFDVVDVGLDQRQQYAPDYVARSITGRVPALSHGDFALAESSAIVEYVDEVFADTGPRLLPASPRARARVRQVMAWIRSDLMALRDERPTWSIFYCPATRPLTPAGVAAAEKLVRVASALVGTTAGGRATVASAVDPDAGWSIADADLGFMLQRLIANGHDVPAPVRDYADAQWARPSVREWVARERPPYVDY